MGAYYDSGLDDDADMLSWKRPMDEGTLVCWKDSDEIAHAGRVRAAGMYMLLVEGLENRDMLTFIKYTDLVWVFEL